MTFKNTLTIIFLLCTLGVTLARTHKKVFRIQSELDSDSFEVNLADWPFLTSKTKEFLWGSRKSGKYKSCPNLSISRTFDIFLYTRFIGDYRIYQKHDRTRRGSSGTKSLNVYHDGIEKITEIVLEVTSENDDVKATIIKGGVGKDKVRIEVTGRDTAYLEYNVDIFGHP